MMHQTVFSRRLRDVTHLVAIADELLGDIDELLELLRHGNGQYEGRYGGYFCGEKERCCWRSRAFPSTCNSFDHETLPNQAPIKLRVPTTTTFPALCTLSLTFLLTIACW